MLSGKSLMRGCKGCDIWIHTLHGEGPLKDGQMHEGIHNQLLDFHLEMLQDFLDEGRSGEPKSALEEPEEHGDIARMGPRLGLFLPGFSTLFWLTQR